MKFTVIQGGKCTPDSPTWQPGERMISVVLGLDRRLTMILGMLIGVALARADLAMASTLAVVVTGDVLTRRVSHREAYRAGVGIGLLLFAMLMARFTVNQIQMLVVGVLVMLELACRLLETLRAYDRIRLIQALSVNRGHTSPYDNGFAARIGKELGSSNLRRGLDVETHKLAKSTRQTYTLLGRFIRVTTDQEADGFGANELELHFRTLAGSRPLLDLMSKLIGLV